MDQIKSPGKLDRSNKLSSNNKRINSSTYDTSNKRSKSEIKEKIPSELLQQLIKNQKQPQHKGKSNWLLDTGGKKNDCNKQASDSVLMNLLVSGFDIRAGYICLSPTK